MDRLFLFQKEKCKTCCVQIPDVRNALLFRDMLGWDISQKLQKNIFFICVIVIELIQSTWVTKTSVFQAMGMTKLSFRHSGTSDFQKLSPQKPYRSYKVAHHFFLIVYDMYS